MGKADALSGRWSSKWGEFRLEVSGGKLSGTWSEGGVDGAVTDEGHVSVTWTHRDGTVGKGSLKADSGFARLLGTWGFGDDDKGEGEWHLDQVERAAATEPAPSDEPPAEGGGAPAGDPVGEAPEGDAPAAAEKKKKK